VKKSSGGVRKKRISCVIHEEANRWLEEEARLGGCSKADVVTEIIHWVWMAETSVLDGKRPEKAIREFIVGGNNIRPCRRCHHVRRGWRWGRGWK